MSRNVLVDHVGACVLEVTGDDLVVWKKEGKELVCLVKWDLTTLRRYYYNETTFKVETGRFVINQFIRHFDLYSTLGNWLGIYSLVATRSGLIRRFLGNEIK